MGLDILQGVAEVFVVTIPLVVVSAGGLLLLSRSRLGEAVARRIAGDSRYSAYQEQVGALQDELAGLRNQLSEMQERVDFAERLLSRADDNRRELPQGDQGATAR
jgi:chromosome segregation ATPase